MLKIPLQEWAEKVQPRILSAGFSVIPNNCKNAFWTSDDEREIHVEFETSQDELMFVLKFMF